MAHSEENSALDNIHNGIDLPTLNPTHVRFTYIVRENKRSVSKYLISPYVRYSPVQKCITWCFSYGFINNGSSLFRLRLPHLRKNKAIKLVPQ